MKPEFLRMNSLSKLSFNENDELFGISDFSQKHHVIANFVTVAVPYLITPNLAIQSRAKSKSVYKPVWMNLLESFVKIFVGHFFGHEHRKGLWPDETEWQFWATQGSEQCGRPTRYRFWFFQCWKILFDTKRKLEKGYAIKGSRIRRTCWAIVLRKFLSISLRSFFY